MPQLSKSEQDRCLVLQGKGHAPEEIRVKLGVTRGKLVPPAPPPDVTSVRRYLRGATHKRGAKETRGRKRAFTPKKMRTLNKIRKQLLKKAKSTYEVTHDPVKSKARVKKSIANSTLSRSFQRTGVQWRPPREKAQRTKEQKVQRQIECEGMKSLPTGLFP